jgi:Holliday junction resolvase RusA-like endonuclease
METFRNYDPQKAAKVNVEKPVISASADYHCDGSGYYRCDFWMPLLPPSVNHYVTHGGGFHRKSAEAKAFERDFTLFNGGYSVNGERFHVTFKFFPGPKQKGDVDNRNKVLLDCIAKAGMLRNFKGEELSDAWVKRLTVEIHDSDKDREQGPKTFVTIEAIG